MLYFFDFLFTKLLLFSDLLVFRMALFLGSKTSLLLSGLLLSLVDSSKSVIVIKITQLCQQGIKPVMLCEGFKGGRNKPISVTLETSLETILVTSVTLSSCLLIFS